jgi:hypothetical protein
LRIVDCGLIAVSNINPHSKIRNPKLCGWAFPRCAKAAQRGRATTGYAIASVLRRKARRNTARQKAAGTLRIPNARDCKGRDYSSNSITENDFRTQKKLASEKSSIEFKIAVLPGG